MARRGLTSAAGGVGLLAALALLAVVGYIRGSVPVAFVTQSDPAARLQVFHDADGRFDEARSHWRATGPDLAPVQPLRLPNNSARMLRLDPAAGATTRVCRLRVGQASADAPFEVAAVNELDVRRESGCLVLTASADAVDPRATLRLVGAAEDTLTAAQYWHRTSMVATGLLCLFLGALAWRFRFRLLHRQWSIPTFGRHAWVSAHGHWLCAGLMLGFGAGYLMLTPPGAVADEEAHAAKILRIAQGVPIGSSGNSLLPDTRILYGAFRDYATNDAPFSRGQVMDQVGQRLDCTPRATNPLTGADGYLPHHYLLPVLAYRTACATGASVGGFLYSARALNLLLATALVCWGIAVAGRGKFALAWVASLPMCLFQLASISADSLVIALSLAWMGLLSGIASGTRSPRSAGLALWLLSLAIACLKPGSAWILAGLLLCKPAYDRAGLSFAGAAVRHVAFPMLLHAGLVLATVGQAPLLDGVDHAANLRMLTSEPFTVLGIMASTLVGDAAILWQMVIGLLGWLDVPLSSWSYALASLLAVASLGSNPPGFPRQPGYVIPLALVAALGSFTLIALPLFLYWTTPGSPIVLGLQGRYFLPTVAFLMVWLARSAPGALRSWLPLAIFIGSAAVNVDGLWHVIDAYYVTGR